MENIKDVTKNMKFVGLVVRRGVDFSDIIEIFKKNDICTLVEKSAYNDKFYNDSWVEFLNLSKILRKTNVIVSLGGDGTLLSVCRKTAGRDVFIIGVNAGNLGFLADVNRNEFVEFLDNFLRGNFIVSNPKILEINLIKPDKKEKKLAINDVVIAGDKKFKMSKIDAFLNGKYFNTYFGDGIIVSSGIGSTAYNMSAFGPIIFPESDVFCLTPICSHSLSQRPLILPKNNVLSFKNLTNNGDILAIIDGQDTIEIKKYIQIDITLSSKHLNLIKNIDYDYFNVLKKKLGWGSK